MRAPGPVVCDGFTLLELLVALSIFGLLAAMSYSGLQAVLQQQSYTEQAAERLGALQKLYLIMQRDIEQIVARPVRDEFGDTQQPVVGGIYPGWLAQPCRPPAQHPATRGLCL